MQSREKCDDILAHNEFSQVFSVGRDYLFSLLSVNLLIEYKKSS